jgi:pyruvate,orthophosphate dikinase
MAELYPILPGSPLAPGGVDEVGGKAWNLLRMARADLPVPPAFVLPTAWCEREGAAAALPGVLAEGVQALETATGHVFGGARRPLLVSVRSGAAVSMPGMMETLLDVGLNAVTVEAVLRETGNPRLAWDCYKRMVQGYAEIVAGLPVAPFEALVAAAVAAADAETERDLDHRGLRALTHAMLTLYAGPPTSSAWPRPWAFSPVPAGEPRTRRWWRGSWTRCAWWPAPALRSTSSAGVAGSAGRSSRRAMNCRSTAIQGPCTRASSR